MEENYSNKILHLILVIIPQELLKIVTKKIVEIKKILKI